MKQQFLIAIAIFLSALMLILGTGILTSFGTFVFTFPQVMGSIWSKAPNGAEYNTQNILMEIGADLGFMFLWQVPQVVKTIVNLAQGGGKLRHEDMVTTLDKVLYSIYVISQFAKNPDEWNNLITEYVD